MDTTLDPDSGSAVIETSPANAPFNAIVMSALPKNSLEAIMAAISPPAAAILVFTKTCATALASSMLLSLSSEPPLNPNQPNQRMNVPRVASGMFEPLIGLIDPSGLYFPARGPSNITPAKAAAAPHM